MNVVRTGRGDRERVAVRRGGAGDDGHGSGRAGRAFLAAAFALAAAAPIWGEAALTRAREVWGGGPPELRAIEATGGTAAHATTLVLRGVRAREEGRLEAAVELHTLAVLLDPRLPAAYQGLAEACLDLGDRACAGRALRALARVVEAGVEAGGGPDRGTPGRAGGR
jgi:Flp pilus assembly protein TadD